MSGFKRGVVAGEKNWEIRLGALQVAVWLGLALGACVGGYFVGFFSGRYVGFEAAREGSAVALAKLPAPELIADASALNPNTVYDRLKAPAVLPEGSGPRASVKPIVKGGVDNVASAPPKVVPRERPEIDDADGIFGDINSGEQLIIGDDESHIDQVRKQVPSSVRLLGAGSGSDVPERALVDSKSVESRRMVAGEASPEAQILDERIAKARSELEQAASEAQKDSQGESPKAIQGEAAKKGTKESEERSKDNALVRKILPPGYFAQVSAPKKLAEAEGVAKRLKRSGFPVVIESASVNGQSFYRVLVGPEDNKQQADRLVEQLQSESFVAGKPFIKRVK